MARPKSIPIRPTLSRLFGQAYLRQLARQTGTVKKDRKVDAKDLFWTVVLDFALGKDSLYVTNVPVEKLAAEDIGSVYATRWMVELLLKVPSASPAQIGRMTCGFAGEVERELTSDLAQNSIRRYFRR